MRTQQNLFEGDTKMQNAAKLKIREAFKINKNETNEKKISELLQNCREVNDFFRKNVVQGVLNSRNAYELKIKPETEKWKHL